MLQKKSSGVTRARFFFILSLLCSNFFVFAETKNVPAGNTDNEVSQDLYTYNEDTTQIFVIGKKIKSFGQVDARMDDSLSIICDKVEKQKKWKTIEVRDGVFVKVSTTSNDTTQIIVNGEKVESLDSLNAGKINYLTVTDNNNRTKEYEESTPGRNSIVELPLKDNVEKVDSYGNVLFVLDGKVVNSIDGIDNNMVDSIMIIRNEAKIKKFGKASKGKDIVIEIKLKK